MDEKNLDLEIFNQIQTMKEFEIVCDAYNYMITKKLIPDSAFVRVLSIMTFRKLTRIANGN